MDKQRSTSYEELVAIQEAFTEYTKGVVFTSEEARSEALTAYTAGFIEYPEEEGGVEEYTQRVKPYLMANLVAPSLVGSIAAALKVELPEAEVEIAAQALAEIKGYYDTLRQEGIPEAAPRLSRYAADVVRFLGKYGKEYYGNIKGRVVDAENYTTFSIMLKKEAPLTEEEIKIAEILKNFTL